MSWVKYKSMLEAKRADLLRTLRHSNEIAVQRTPDLLEEAQLAADQELALRSLDRESNLLRQIDAALARIAGGTYRICLHCGGEIGARRIEAIPWAGYCIRCQASAEQQEVTSNISAGEVTAKAA